MAAKTTHFKVDNGDMALIELESGRRLLVDCRIRGGADDPDDETPDVGGQLRARLEQLGRDTKGRLFVDGFLLTHPDQDHCGGLINHFHLGSPDAWREDDDLILVREMWSSPIVFRRANRKAGFTLCADAQAWAAEARRRVAHFRAYGSARDGDRIKILGKDVEGKTDDLSAILVKAGETFTTIVGDYDRSFSALLLAPMLASDDAEADTLSKNNSSVILRLTMVADGVPAAARYLFGGDAEVAIWEKIDARYGRDQLAYDVLIAPHHCSWHSLSWDSWSKKTADARVSAGARNALAGANVGATILASSCTIEDDDDDPPCIRAKREYESILRPVSGTFRCLADETGDDPLEFTVGRWGPRVGRRRATTGAAYTGVARPRSATAGLDPDRDGAGAEARPCAPRRCRGPAGVT